MVCTVRLATRAQGSGPQGGGAGASVVVSYVLLLWPDRRAAAVGAPTHCHLALHSFKRPQATGRCSRATKGLFGAAVQVPLMSKPSSRSHARPSTRHAPVGLSACGLRRAVPAPADEPTLPERPAAGGLCAGALGTQGTHTLTCLAEPCLPVTPPEGSSPLHLAPHITRRSTVLWLVRPSHCATFSLAAFALRLKPSLKTCLRCPIITLQS